MDRAIAGITTRVSRHVSARSPWPLVAVATLCAFAGALLGKRLLSKVTIQLLHFIVGGLLAVVGIALALGIA